MRDPHSANPNAAQPPAYAEALAAVPPPAPERDDRAAAEAALATRAAALDDREAALTDREAALDAREAALTDREAAFALQQAAADTAAPVEVTADGKVIDATAMAKDALDAIERQPVADASAPTDDGQPAAETD